jgi:GT2 family glycosyltransferase
VDNGSSDGSAELVAARFPAVRCIQTGENLVFAAGCNRGLAAARGEWLAVLNNDTEVCADWLAQLRAAAIASDDRVGMLQSRMLFKQRPERTNSTGVELYLDGSFADRDYERAADEPSSEDVFCASAGAALYRREMLERVELDTGIFDQSFFMYFEDVDLGWRCRLAGYTARYVPSAVVYHAFRGSSSRRGDDFVALHCARNRVRTLLKNASLRHLLRSAPRMLRDLIWLSRRRGFATVFDYARACASGLRQRGVVRDLSRVGKAELEAVWLRPRRSQA